MVDYTRPRAGHGARKRVDQKDRAEAATNSNGPSHSHQPSQEVGAMPYAAYLAQHTSARNPEQEENTWQRVDHVAARLLRKCEQAIDAGHFEAAETYHAQFVKEATK